MKVSAIVLCFNEEKRISDCLQSLQFVDEVLVLDSFSQDGSVEIIKSFKNAKVVSYDWLGFGPMRNLGIEQAANDWILTIDADEVVDLRLATEILNLSVDKVNQNNMAFRIHRKNYFYRDYLPSTYPDQPIRLFHRDFACYNNAAVHEQVVFTSKGEKQQIDTHKVPILNFPIHHYSNDSISNYLKKLNNYTNLEIKKKRKDKNPTMIFLAFFFDFFKYLFLKKGIIGGYTGMMYSLLSAFYLMVRDLKYWELKNKIEKK